MSDWPPPVVQLAVDNLIVGRRQLQVGRRQLYSWPWTTWKLAVDSLTVGHGQLDSWPWITILIAGQIAQRRLFTAATRLPRQAINRLFPKPWQRP